MYFSFRYPTVVGQLSNSVRFVYRLSTTLYDALAGQHVSKRFELSSFDNHHHIVPSTANTVADFDPISLGRQSGIKTVRILFWGCRSGIELHFCAMSTTTKHLVYVVYYVACDPVAGKYII